MAHTRRMLDKQGYTRARMHTPTRPGKRTHARTHTQKICTIYCFPTATMIRERASKLRYTYIACFVYYSC